MKKMTLAVLMLCLVCSFTACKKESAPEGAETIEEKDDESLELEESLEIELEEGTEGSVAPD